MLRSAIAAVMAAASLSATSAAAATIADTYSSFWVFGDSLSDNGNVAAVLAAGTPSIDFPPPPYFDGRFTSGPVWNERFLADYGPGRAANFAFGGARAVEDGDVIPDLPLQVGAFLSALPALQPGQRSLASLFFGANDMFDAVSAAAAVTPEAVPGVLGARAQAAAAGIASAVTMLRTAGIDEFVLWNLPDIGSTPRLRELGAGAQMLGTGATLTFNGAFVQMVADLRAAGLTIHTVDTFGLFTAATANPDAFGFTNVTDACLPVDPFEVLGAPSAGTACADPDKFLYWDKLHPTAPGHDAFAAAFDAAVPAVPLPASALLLLAGMGGMAALRRRAR